MGPRAAYGSRRGPTSIGGATAGGGAAGIDWAKFFGGGAQTGGGAGRWGGGGGGRGGPVVPPYGGGGGNPWGYGSDVAANPYLEKVFQKYEDLWNRMGELDKETYNKEPAIQDYQRMRAQGMKEAQAQAGGRGFAPGTGMSLAQMSQYGAGTEQGAQGLAGNLWNQGIDKRMQLANSMAAALGGWGGAGSAIQSGMLGAGGLGFQYAQLGSNSALRQQELEMERERASRQAQMDAFRTIAPYLFSVA